MKRVVYQIKLPGTLSYKYGIFVIALALTACSKNINIAIPSSAQQVVVDGSIQNGVPPIILLTKSQQFFGTTNLNNLGAYFVHGATVKVTGSDGTRAQLVEFCLGDLNLPAAQTQQLLSALGYTTVDSANALNICAYTVSDIITYYATGNCSYAGKLNTAYQLSIVAPPLSTSQHDSIHLSSSTTIPNTAGIDSLAVRPDPNPQYADSMALVYIYITVPDTMGNFIRYETKVNSQPFYTGLLGSVYDDRLYVGSTFDLPIEHGVPPGTIFNANTDFSFDRGDTVTVMWSNIDINTYNFFYTLENDGGGSPFSSPVKIEGNINNGLGVWAGYATKYYSIIIPH